MTPNNGAIEAVVPADPDNGPPPADPRRPSRPRTRRRRLDARRRRRPARPANRRGRGLATFVVPLPEGTAAVELRRGDTVLDRRDRSRPPSLELLAPTDRGRSRDGSADVRWNASDPDGDELQVTVEYAANGRTGWRSVFAGPSTGARRSPAASWRPAARARRASRSATASTDPRRLVAVRRRGGRTGRDDRHARGRRAAAGRHPRRAHGSAVDAAGKHLRGRALTWFAGTKRLGTGERLRVQLPVGRTTLRLRARDARGRETVVTRTLTVDPVALRADRLQGPARVAAGAKTAT